MSEAKATKAKDEMAAPAVRALTESRLVVTNSSEGRIGNRFAATTPMGTPFEHVLAPEFWAQVAYKLRPGDEVTVHTDDMTYYGRLYVRDVSGAAGTRLNNRAIVAELELHEFGLVKRELKTKTHEVKFLGPYAQWTVVAIADQKPVKDGFGTAEQAAEWMKSLAA